MEKGAVDAVLKNISNPDSLITNPSQAANELTFALMSQGKLFDILFSDSRAHILINQLEQWLKDKIYTMYPEYKNNLEWDILLSVLIQGCFHAFATHMNDADINELVEIIGNINGRILSNE